MYCGLLAVLLSAAATCGCRHDCAPSVVSTFVNPATFPCSSGRCDLSALAVIGKDVYWALIDGTGFGTCAGGIYRAPRSGGTSTALDSGCVASLSWDRERVYWADVASGQDPSDPTILYPPQNYNNFANLTLTSAIPEPSTIALAGLGLAGLLAFRRRS